MKSPDGVFSFEAHKQKKASQGQVSLYEMLRQGNASDEAILARQSYLHKEIARLEMEKKRLYEDAVTAWESDGKVWDRAASDEFAIKTLDFEQNLSNLRAEAEARPPAKLIGPGKVVSSLYEPAKRQYDAWNTVSE